MTEVITIYNKRPTEKYYCLDAFHFSLGQFGYTPTVLGYAEPWGGLMTKPRKLEKYLETSCAAEHVIVVDAFDVVFVKSPEEIVSRFIEFNADVVFGAEINCFPEVGMACDFPHVESPFKYLNSGVMVGTREGILKILQSMNPGSVPDDHQKDGRWICPNDQWYYQLEYFKQPCKIVLDYEARIALNCVGVEDEMPYDPCIFHFNGGSKEGAIKDRILLKL